jgi:hypothetical protein
MSKQRQLKGYIFKTIRGWYYGAVRCGSVLDRASAYVYSLKEIEEMVQKDKDLNDNYIGRCGWGGKRCGTWILVYE